MICQLYEYAYISKSFYSIFTVVTRCSFISPLILSVKHMREEVELNAFILSNVSLFILQTAPDSVKHQHQQKYMKTNVTVTAALYLYDLASRLAGDCLLGEEEEEEEGRR